MTGYYHRPPIDSCSASQTAQRERSNNDNEQTASAIANYTQMQNLNGKLGSICT